MRRVGLAALAGLMLATGGGAQERALSPGQLRAEAARALQLGRPQVALSYAQALVARDGDDFDAQLLRARSARDLSVFDEARAGAAAARRLAEGDEQRFAAALVSAQVAASQGHHMIGQLRLRQAIEAAPSPALRKVAERDFYYVRARNPWGVNLSFSVAPVSNINNGSKKTTGTYELPFFGVVEAELQGSAVALSGTEVKGGLNLRYRLKETDMRHQTDLLLTLSQADYTLSEDAKDKAPGAEGSDFAFGLAQLGLAHRGLSGAPQRPYQVMLAAGRTWYGGDPYTSYVDGTAVQGFALGQGRMVQLSAGLRQQEAESTATADATSWRAGAGWRQTLGAGHDLTLDLTRLASQSDAASLDYAGWSAAAGLRLAEPVLGLGIEFGLTAGRKDFSSGPVAGEQRSDHSFGAEITAEIRQLDYYGFLPTVTVSGQRVESDFGQYDADELGLRLGLRSAF